MQRKRAFRMVAMLCAVAILAAACGSDDDDATGNDQALTIGHIWPETGDAALLGPPQFEAVKLAVEDINAAGGVLDEDVELLHGDEAGDAARALDAAERLLREDASAIIGAATSDMSQAIIQTLFDNEIVQCSPSNTAPDFTEQHDENAGFYFRTVPPDEAVAPIIAEQIIADGAQSAVVAGRGDDYGDGLTSLIAEDLTDAGVEVRGDAVLYNPDATSFDTEISTVVSRNPDAVAVIAFGKEAGFINGLIEAGLSADQLYGGDAIFTPVLPSEVNPDDERVIDGMKVIGAAGGTDFNDRINEEANLEDNLIYAAQAYDCAVITALAAEAADTNVATEFIDEMTDVTRDGTECTTFEQCKQLLDDNQEIDYEGVAGPLELDDVGDPQFGRYAIAEFQDGGQLEQIGEQDQDVAELRDGEE